MKAKNSVIFAFMFCILALTLCACRLQNVVPPQIQPAVQQPQTVESTPEPTPEPTPELQPIDYYRDILNRWYTAAVEKWDMETLENNSLNYMAAYCYADNPTDRLGFQLRDLDGDGITELLVGSMMGDDYQDLIVLELYTVKDGSPVQVFSSGERDRYYLCSDGTFANEGSSSAFESTYNYYSYTNGELVLNGSVKFDMAANREQPYFFETSGERINVDEASATAKINEYKALYVKPGYTPFSQYQ